jgi:hypothetical protein
MEHVRLEPVPAERCVQEAERLRTEAQQLPPGTPSTGAYQEGAGNVHGRASC